MLTNLIGRLIINDSDSCCYCCSGNVPRAHKELSNLSRYMSACHDFVVVVVVVVFVVMYDVVVVHVVVVVVVVVVVMFHVLVRS